MGRPLYSEQTQINAVTGKYTVQERLGFTQLLSEGQSEIIELYAPTNHIGKIKFIGFYFVRPNYLNSSISGKHSVSLQAMNNLSVFNNGNVYNDTIKMQYMELTAFDTRNPTTDDFLRKNILNVPFTDEIPLTFAYTNNTNENLQCGGYPNHVIDLIIEYEKVK